MGFFDKLKQGLNKTKESLNKQCIQQIQKSR